MPKYFEFEVSLRDIKPRIWRRFLLATSATFSDLHDAIQASFGWGGYHLWDFRGPKRLDPVLAAPGPDELDFHDPDEVEEPDADLVALASFFTAGRKVERCVYRYDFGDDWQHDVKRVAVRTEEASFERRLLAGELAGPPEDCGGQPGYDRLVEIFETGRDPWEEDASVLAEWLGDWRPDGFELATVKAHFDR